MMDKGELLAPRTDTASGQPEDDVDIPGLGTVRVRGLSRVEVMLLRKATDTEQMDGSRALVLERKMVSTGMVHPALTESEVGRWQEIGSAGELDPVSSRIAELSGMSEGAPKSDLPADGDGPGAGVRVLPSGEAGPDGGGAAGVPE